MRSFDTGRFAEVPAEVLAEVSSADGAARLVRAMLDDLRRHPEAWENHTLDRYLDALAAVLDGRSEPDVAWADLTAVLLAASGYE